MESKKDLEDDSTKVAQGRNPRLRFHGPSTRRQWAGIRTPFPPFTGVRHVVLYSRGASGRQVPQLAVLAWIGMKRRKSAVPTLVTLLVFLLVIVLLIRQQQTPPR